MSHTQPTLVHLIVDLDPVKAKWRRFGTFLDISDDELESIEVDCHNCEDKLREVCRKWLQTQPAGTWTDIIEALENMGRYDIVKDIRTKHFPEELKKKRKRKPKKKKSDSLAYQNVDTTIEDEQSTQREVSFDTKPIIIPLLLLYCKFDNIFSSMQTDLNRFLNAGRLNFEQFNRFVCNFFSISLIKISFSGNTDRIDALFKTLGDQFNCFHTTLLHGIDYSYLKNAYNKQIIAYDNDVDVFVKEKFIVELKDMIETTQTENFPGTVVILKLGNFWDDRKVSNLNHLVKKLFGHNAALLKLVRIHHSLLTIVYKTPTWLGLSLILNAARVSKEVAYTRIRSVQVGRILLRFRQKGSPFERLMMIPEGPDPQEIQFLFDIGANINTRNIYGTMPVHRAMVFKFHHALRKLLCLSRKQMASIDHMSGFIIDGAHIPGYRHCIFLLLKYGVNPNSLNLTGETPLLLASWRGDEKLVSLLLRWKADPNIPSQDGVTALYAASQDGYVACVKLLLKHNANPNINDTMAGMGKSPLYMACQGGHYKCAELLLKANADPNVQKTNGATPLYIVSHDGNNKIIKLLLRFNADPNILRYDGFSPALIARIKGHNECLESLLYSE